ncbi:MAG TPA: hypothetical protein PKA90_15380, partial [Ignavibacteria bacterium]|nr:hypothetical protein [Ignavibacteria bacterium]
QEVIQNTKKIFYEELPKFGFKYIADNSFENPAEHKGPRKYCLLTASKVKIIKLENFAEVGWSEKILRTRFWKGDKKIELVNTQIPPGSSNGVRKEITFKEIYKNLEKSKHKYKILCGDWNSPQEEFPGGKIMTWGEKYGRNKEITKYKANKDECERLLLEKTNNLDLYDDFRRVHGYKVNEYSWVHKNKTKTTHRRYDHIYSTKNLDLKDCHYEHSFREKGLSDHSAIVSEYEIED